MLYKDGFREREYWIMLEKEQNGKTLTEIAKMLGVTKSAVQESYRKTKQKRKKLYLKAIGDATGKSKAEVEQLDKQLQEEYWDDIYTCAYLEKEYGEILAAFRNGEPGVPDKIIQILPPLRGVSIPAYRCNSSIPPRIELNQEESLVMQKREKGKSFVEIGALLGVTDTKAQRIYEMAKHTLMNRDIAIVCTETGLSYDMVKKLLSDITKDFRKWPKYLDQKYGDILHKN